jgi:hypothetical protein
MITLLLVIYLLIGVIYIGIMLVENLKEGVFDGKQKSLLVMAAITAIIFWPAIYIMAVIRER